MTNLDYFNGSSLTMDSPLPNDPPQPSTNSLYGLINKALEIFAPKVQQPNTVKPTPVVQQANYAMWAILAVIVIGSIYLIKNG